MNGQKMDSTTYVKGPRKRTESGGMMGMGGDVATVEQCDLKQNIKISDKKKMYAVEPFDTDAAQSAPVRSTDPKPKPAPVKRGGTVTYVSNITDTGERKQMFGVTARHIKSSMSVETSPDACSKENMKMETDGWYIDLPEFSCPVVMRPQMPGMGGPRGGCQDKIEQRTTGGGKPGFPLSESRSMNMGDGQMSFTQTTETLEFSRSPLDAALFDIPQGYARTNNSQDLYGRPDFSAMMRGGQSTNDDEDKPKSTPSRSAPNMPMQIGTPNAKKAGTIRIGVLAPTNRGGEAISITNMQAYLAQKLTSGNVEGIAVTSEADARSAGCDYVLSSDFSKLKQSTASKIGGMFGKVTNTDTSASRTYDTQVDFKLVSLKRGRRQCKIRPRLRPKAMSIVRPRAFWQWRRPPFWASRSKFALNSYPAGRIRHLLPVPARFE